MYHDTYLSVTKLVEKACLISTWLFNFRVIRQHDHDARHTHVGPLRAIDEDRVVPGRGFHPHRHQDMEIISRPRMAAHQATKRSTSTPRRRKGGEEAVVNLGQARDAEVLLFDLPA